LNEDTSLFFEKNHSLPKKETIKKEISKGQNKKILKKKWILRTERPFKRNPSFLS